MQTGVHTGVQTGVQSRAGGTAGQGGAAAVLHTVQVYMRLWCRTATWKVRPPKASLSVEKSRVSCCRLVGASHWDASHWDVAPIKRQRENLQW